MVRAKIRADYTSSAIATDLLHRVICTRKRRRPTPRGQSSCSMGIPGREDPFVNKIEGSVGQNGDNLEDDVRLVQGLLNRQDLAPLSPIKEDGRIDSATIEAIRH